MFSASDLSKGYIVSWACAWYGTSLTHSCRGSISTISILITKIWKFYSQQWVIIGQQKQAKIWKTKIVKGRPFNHVLLKSLAVCRDKTKIHLFLGQNWMSSLLGMGRDVELSTQVDSSGVKELSKYHNKIQLDSKILEFSSIVSNANLTRLHQFDPYLVLIFTYLCWDSQWGRGLELDVPGNIASRECRKYIS